jgi:hypothetical protein
MCEKYIDNPAQGKELFDFPSSFFSAVQLLPPAKFTARSTRQNR